MFNVCGLRVCLAAAFLALMPVTAFAQSGRAVTVLAAASLTNVMQEVGKRYESASGRKVVFLCRVDDLGQADRGERGRGYVHLSDRPQSMDYGTTCPGFV